ncbi:helix-turn-helix domain-containing protein [Nocardia sp. SC052]|uniref:helix-turn-helix domain-containing protein n=1 Tax=Nocardia sichangensis TaxID=3385975 RepID=UPI0039A19C5B
MSAKSGGSMLSRGLALLSAFEPEDRDLSQVELCRRTGLPKPTVHRLVAELVSWGALERTGNGVRLGPWLYRLGQHVPNIRLLRAVGQPHLDRLHGLTRQYASLAVLCGERTVDAAWAGPPVWRHVAADVRTQAVSLAAVNVLRVPGAEGDPTVVKVDGPHLASAAVPVRVHGFTVAALSIVGYADLFNAPAYDAPLRTAAGGISRRLSLTDVFGKNTIAS